MKDVMLKQLGLGQAKGTGGRAYTYELQLPDFQGTDPGEVQSALARLANGLLVPHVRVMKVAGEPWSALLTATWTSAAWVGWRPAPWVSPPLPR